MYAIAIVPTVVRSRTVAATEGHRAYLGQLKADGA